MIIVNRIIFSKFAIDVTSLLLVFPTDTPSLLIPMPLITEPFPSTDAHYAYLLAHNSLQNVSNKSINT